MSRRPHSDANPVRLSAILDDSKTSLGDLIQRAEGLLQLQRILSSSVEPELADRFQVANVRQDRVILIAPTPTWATALRMRAAELLATLHRAGHDYLRSIEIRVYPLVEQPAPERRERRLSGAAAVALELMSRLGDTKAD